MSVTRNILIVVCGLYPLTVAAQTPAGTVAGTVVARETGRVIAEAVVTIDGTDRTATTNGVGRFRFENVPDGLLVLVVHLTLSGHNLRNEAYYWNGDGETADPGRPRQVLLTTSLLFK